MTDSSDSRGEKSKLSLCAVDVSDQLSFYP